MIDPAAMAKMAGALQPAVGAGGPPMVPPPEAGPMMMPPPMGGPPPEPEKPHLILPPKLAKSLAQGYVDQVRQMAQMLADQAGVPDEFQRFSLKDQVKAYYKRDARQDPLALKDQGLSDIEIRDKVYPLRRILLKMAGPRPDDRVKFAQRMKAERARLDTIQGDDTAPAP